MSFKRGVFDVTDFIDRHPGGGRIMMGAGESLEHLWDYYPLHYRPDVTEILKRYRIGNLAAEDLFDNSSHVDYFKNEPKRDTKIHVLVTTPFNADILPPDLLQGFYKPNEIFYVRNHHPVPDVDVNTYQLEISGIGLNTTVLRMQDLRKIPKVQITATVQCIGNCRADMGKVKPVAGVQFLGGAIGNAKWGGVRLRNLLFDLGFDPKNYSNLGEMHVQFESLDCDPMGWCYGTSLPLRYILDETFDTLLAYEMNGRDILPDHRFQLRLIAPGIIGARNVKLLGKVIISDEESKTPWQQIDNKAFSPSVTVETVDYSSAPPAMEMSVNSYICSHVDGQVVQQGNVKIKGYAFSGGGRSILRVDVFINDKNDVNQGMWKVANILKNATPAVGRNWAWTHSETDVNVTKNSTEVWVKVVDSEYN